MLNEKQVLLLQQLPKIGRKTIFKIAALLDAELSDEALFGFLQQWNVNDKYLTDTSALQQAAEKAEAIMRRCKELEIELIAYWNKQFPHLLKAISDPPVLLFVSGNAALLNAKKIITITGTRKASPYALRAGRRIAELFAQYDFVIVSGLAEGCDAAAHRGCLDANGYTIATLAHGLDMIYPYQHTVLAQEIVQEGGTLVSEYPPGTKPSAGAFVERSRLKSGLGAAVIIIESGTGRGTLHTLRYSEESKKPVACLRHPFKYADDPKAGGNALLVSERRAQGLGTREEIDTFMHNVLQYIGLQG